MTGASTTVRDAPVDQARVQDSLPLTDQARFPLKTGKGTVRPDTHVKDKGRLRQGRTEPAQWRYFGSDCPRGRGGRASGTSGTSGQAVLPRGLLTGPGSARSLAV